MRGPAGVPIAQGTGWSSRTFPSPGAEMESSAPSKRSESLSEGRPAVNGGGVWHHWTGGGGAVPPQVTTTGFDCQRWPLKVSVATPTVN